VVSGPADAYQALNLDLGHAVFSKGLNLFELLQTILNRGLVYHSFNKNLSLFASYPVPPSSGASHDRGASPDFLFLLV